MKRIILLWLIASVVGCVDKGKFDDIKINVKTALPMGSYKIKAENFVDMLGFDVSEMAPDKVVVMSYKDESHAVLGDKTIANIVKVEDQDNLASFDISSITSTVPSGGSKDINIEEDGFSDIFTSKVDLSFKDQSRPSKVVFSSATITVEANTGMPTQGLYVEIDGIVKDGVPLSVNFGESKSLDGYEMNVIVEDGKDPHIVVEVKGTTTVKENSTLSANIKLANVVVKYIEGDMGRHVEYNTTNFRLDNLSSLDMVEEFYPDNIGFNIDIDNGFESLPMLLHISKLTFMDKNNPSNDVDIDIKEGLNVDRFFLSKGHNSIRVDNSMTVSGKGFSEAFSKDLNNVKVYYTIIINPTDVDASGEVPQDKNNKVSVDTKITSPAYINVPLKGYIKGVSIDTIMELDINMKDFKASGIQYNISAINSFPLDLEMSLVIIDKITKDVISEDMEPIKIKGAGAIPFDPSNVRTISGDPAFWLFNKEAYLGLRFRGNTVGVENKEIVSFLGGDSIEMMLFLGLDGVID